MADDRVPCRVCGRNFNPESLTRHEKVCAKQTTKKPRKVFDSGRQRAAGSDVPYTKTLKPQATYAPQAQASQYSAPRGNDAKFGFKGNNGMQGGRDMPKKSNWRRQHEDFIAAVRAAKAYGQAVKTGGPLPPPAPPSENPDYVSCPTCGRRFNEKAAARHISFCAEQSNRVTTRRMPDSNAKMRANARGYVAPTPGVKPKSTSGGGGRGLMGTTTLGGGGGDYVYDSYATNPSQPQRYGAPQPARRAGPSGGNGSGGAGGRYAAANRQMVDDGDYDAYPAAAAGPRGSRLGGGVQTRTQPGVSSGRLAPVSGGGPRGGAVGGSSAFGNRSQPAGGAQAMYLGASPNGGMQARGGRQPANMGDTYGDYESMPIGGGSSKPVGSRGGMSRPAPASESGQFCYECGNQYPSKAAKFCVECGVKRVGF